MDANHRLHALDNIRAHMMLLGVVFHVGINYAGGTPRETWPFRDNSVSQVIAGLLDFLHVFRMPVFFIVAGFFAALLIRRRSLRGFLVNRSQRILVPFLLFLFPTLWVCGNAVLAGSAVMEGQDFQWHSLMELPRWSLFHLWFLYFLLIYYAVLSIGWWWAKHAAPRVKLSVDGKKMNALLTRHGPCVWGFLAGIGLYFNGAPRVSAPGSLLPDPASLFYYSVFFLAGACLYGIKTPLRSLGQNIKYWWTIWVVALFGFVGAEMVVLTPEGLEDRSYSLPGAVFQGVATCSLCFIIIGLYLRFGEKQSPLTRYFTDASYWIYLIHLPMTLWLPLWIADWQWGAWTKFGFCVLVITLVSLLTYHLLVRSSGLGRLLNGRQYPFVLPDWRSGSYNTSRQT